MTTECSLLPLPPKTSTLEVTVISFLFSKLWLLHAKARAEFERGPEVGSDLKSTGSWGEII